MTEVWNILKVMNRTRLENITLMSEESRGLLGWGLFPGQLFMYNDQDLS